MEYSNIMTDAVNIFNDRNPKYGDMKIGMEKVATIATIITGIHLTPHDVALVLHAVKLSRLNNDRANPDHYVDGVNYLAFAGELITEPPSDPYSIENAMRQELDNNVGEITHQKPESD
jgi:hypothetical protein